MIDYDLLIALNKQHIQELHAEAARLRLVTTVRRLARSRQRTEPRKSLAIVTGKQVQQPEAREGG
jgi:hypothetical protein